MPSLPTPKGIGRGRMFGKSGKDRNIVVAEELKQQHARELARANDEHAQKVERLEDELDRCRSKMEALRSLSEEHKDTLTPLPQVNLKYVKKPSPRKPPRNDANAASVITELKLQHKKDLARAAQVYGMKLQSMAQEVQRLKGESEASKRARLRGGKENVTNVQMDRSDQSKKSLSALPKNKNDTLQSRRVLPREKDARCERLFLDEYDVEKDPALEKAIASLSNSDKAAVDIEEIDKYCKDVADFIADVRAKSLDGN